MGYDEFNFDVVSPSSGLTDVFSRPVSSFMSVVPQLRYRCPFSQRVSEQGPEVITCLWIDTRAGRSRDAFRQNGTVGSKHLTGNVGGLPIFLGLGFRPLSGIRSGIASTVF